MPAAPTLRISPSLTLPADAVTQTFGCIGRKGAGKTYLAGVLAEQMLSIHAQVIVLDVVGNWWGLRVAADGRAQGKQIFVIGGEHGDVPITADSGARIARFLVEKSVSAVLDISSFRQGERKRFAADFAEEFFHLKKTQRSAVHLFIEEAQLLVPQRCGPDEARMLGAFENIVRLGRNYGIGATLISQRPQSVNKEVLSQVECLCVLQVNGSHERRALEEWVQEAGADRKLVGELPGLARGEGYVWSPSWLRVFQRVKFASKTTFDASATPEVGKQVRAASLSSVDVDALRSDLQEVVARAEQDDPRALRRRIAELEKTARQQAAGKPAVVAVPDPSILASLRERIRELEAYAKSTARTIDKFRAQAPKLHDIADILEGVKLIAELSGKPEIAAVATAAAPARSLQPQPRLSSAARPASSNGHQPPSPLSNPEQRIVNAIAWMEHIGVPQPNQTAVAFLAGYTYGSGGFNNPRGRLNQLGLIRYLAGNQIELTTEGRALAEFPSSSVSQEELHRSVLERLPNPEQRILRPLIEAWPRSVSNYDLAKAANYAQDSGGFNNPRGRLRSLGLIEYVGGGEVRARDILFPEGASR